jgi:hypothetical protein
MIISESLFAETFRENVRRRSRSASGKDGNSVSGSNKRKMLLSGDALAAQVAKNVEALIADVHRVPLYHGTRGSLLRCACERWFDIATDGLVDFDGYQSEHLRVGGVADLLSANMGMKFGHSHRYRLWTPVYNTVADIPPQLIDHFMSLFYEEYARRFRHVRGAGSDEAVVELMAYADVMMDGIIHPWLDACSRVSLALVMWTALRLGGPLPLYGPDKKVHVSTLTDLAQHTAYFRECVRRHGTWGAGR